ncbi:MAG: hypothetical protein DMG07_04530, partial [Acidobacteria bacterium]
ASRNLTLTLGLRWEYYPFMTRTFDGFERYDLDTGKVLIGRFGGIDDNAGIEVSKKLFAPRVGVAYRLGDRGVIRSGYGITIDPYPMARPMRSPYPVVIWSDNEGPNTFQPYGSLEKGIPAIVPPDITKGTIDIPANVGTRTMERGPFKRGYIQSWNLFYERQLPGRFVGSAGYVGTHSVHQLANLEANTAAPGTGTPGRILNQRFGRTATTGLVAPWADSDYHALQSSLDRRFSNGFFLKTAYTWSRAINSLDNSQEGTVYFMYPTYWSRNRGVAGYDRTHNLRVAWLYELPFGSSKHWAQSGAGRALLAGWQLNGIFSAYSGTPFTVTASGTSLASQGSNQVADQILPDVALLGGIGLGNPYFDPAAFKALNEPRYGNVGRNSLRGPGYVNVDLSLFRRFRVTERLNMEFRAESANLTNTPHFNNPNANASIANTFMMITGARDDARSFRFGWRFSF